jgi:hypothetical protein
VKESRSDRGSDGNITYLAQTPTPKQVPQKAT